MLSGRSSVKDLLGRTRTLSIGSISAASSMHPGDTGLLSRQRCGAYIECVCACQPSLLHQLLSRRSSVNKLTRCASTLSSARADGSLACRSLTPSRSALRSGLLQRGSSRVAAEAPVPPPVPLDVLGHTASGLTIVQPGSLQSQVCSLKSCQTSE